MALVSANNSTFTLCDERTDRFENLAYYLQAFVCVRLLLSVCACVASLKLLYLQTKSSVWFEGERPLILGILVANIIGPSTVIIAAVTRLVKFIFPLLRTKQVYISWMIMIGDASTLSLVLYIAAISLKSYLSVRFFYDNDKKESVGKVGLTVLTVFIMISAFVLSVFGFNTHGQAIVSVSPFVTDIVFYCVCLCVQIATAFILYKTKLLSNRLQMDFVINRTEQKLESRVSLHRVVERTRVLIPLSAVNVFLWVAIWSLDFMVDRMIDAAKADSCRTPPEYYIWSSIMDCASALYGLVYPSMLCRKGETFSKRIKKAICLKYDLNSDSPATIPVTLEGNSNAMNRVGPAGNNGDKIYWSTLTTQWTRVAKFHKETPLGNTDSKTTTAL